MPDPADDDVQPPDGADQLDFDHANDAEVWIANAVHDLRNSAEHHLVGDTVTDEVGSLRRLDADGLDPHTILVELTNADAGLPADRAARELLYRLDDRYPQSTRM
ncbi:MAG: hypothetical protein JWN95_3679 [Frankiales bacterium]|nr:hypothetical protein [Frankiales bacterium]